MTKNLEKVTSFDGNSSEMDEAATKAAIIKAYQEFPMYDLMLDGTPDKLKYYDPGRKRPKLPPDYSPEMFAPSQEQQDSARTALGDLWERKPKLAEQLYDLILNSSDISHNNPEAKVVRCCETVTGVLILFESSHGIFMHHHGHMGTKVLEIIGFGCVGSVYSPLSEDSDFYSDDPEKREKAWQEEMNVIKFDSPEYCNAAGYSEEYKKVHGLCDEVQDCFDESFGDELTEEELAILEDLPFSKDWKGFWEKFQWYELKGILEE